MTARIPRHSPPGAFGAIALALLLGWGAGCGALSTADEGATPGGGALGELVLAQLGEVIVPEQVFLGEALTITVRGLHPDGCTTFERFETRRSAGKIDLGAWAFRPLGACASPGEAFEAVATLEGLEAGVYLVRVNEHFEASVAVLAAGGAPPLCQGAPAPSIDQVVLPPTTHPGGSAEVTISGSLPSWCDRLLAPVLTRNANLLQIVIEAEGCPLEAYDPSLCPVGPKPFTLRVPLTPLVEGRHAVRVNGVDAGVLQVVASSNCRFTPLDLGRLELPARVEAGASFRVGLEGTVGSACAALDALGARVGAGTLTLDARVRACDASCAPLPVPRPVRRSLRIEGLSEGSWQVSVSGASITSSLEVLAPGTCARVALPDGSVEQVLVTTALSFADARAGQPVDISVYGRLPAGCWETPILQGGVVGSTLALHTQSARCAAICDPSGASFVTSLAFPDGLAAGPYDLTVDGAPFTTFDVQ